MRANGQETLGKSLCLCRKLSPSPLPPPKAGLERGLGWPGSLALIRVMRSCRAEMSCQDSGHGSTDPLTDGGRKARQTAAWAERGPSRGPVEGEP